MSAVLTPQPTIERTTPPRAGLTVQRHDVSFQSIDTHRVRISVRVWNEDDTWSVPTAMTIQAAPLGAFVPWRDLTIVSVPAIPPRESREVVFDAAVPPRRHLGDFRTIPPGKLLTAMAGDDDSPARDATANFAMALLQSLFPRAKRQAPAGVLPNDPFDLLSRANPHWAGNINILMDGRAVERHMAQTLRVYPGRTNVALFFVGSQRDAYKFDVEGSAAAWESSLFDVSDMPTLLCARSTAREIPQSQWIPMDRMRMVLLALCPPEYCGQGSIEVHVCQRSTGQEAIVEFSLDPRAAGAGCYTL